MDEKIKVLYEKRKKKYTQVVITKEIKEKIDELCKISFRSASGEIAYQITKALDKSKELPDD